MIHVLYRNTRVRHSEILITTFTYLPRRLAHLHQVHNHGSGARLIRLEATTLVQVALDYHSQGQSTSRSLPRPSALSVSTLVLVMWITRGGESTKEKRGAPSRPPWWSSRNRQTELPLISSIGRHPTMPSRLEHTQRNPRYITGYLSGPTVPYMATLAGISTRLWRRRKIPASTTRLSVLPYKTIDKTVLQTKDPPWIGFFFSTRRENIIHTRE